MKKKKKQQLQELTELMIAERGNMLRYAFYRLGNCDEAEDMVQDAYLRLYTQISEGGGKDITNLRNYLFRILSNLCTNKIANRRDYLIIDLESACEMPDITTEDNEGDYARITQMLRQLPEEQAEVIRLRIYGNKSFAEIAEILCLPLPTVKSRFLYGLNKMRKGLNITVKQIKLTRKNDK